jgi:Iap family predicted aminopeptidase
MKGHHKIMKKIWRVSLFSVKLIYLVIIIIFNQILYSQVSPVWYQLVGSAFLDNCSYDFLQRVSDEAGGRLVGTPGNLKAAAIIREQAEILDLPLVSENFSMPGWVRGEDRLLVLSPLEKKLQAFALGYVNSHPSFEAELVYASFGFSEDYQNLNVRNKIVLLLSEKPADRTPLLRQEAIGIAAGHGAKAVLFIHSKPGSSNMVGSGDFQGNHTLIPAFSLTYEEGHWLKRLLEKNHPVRMLLEVKSYCQDLTTENLIVRFPGQVQQKIVLGAHYDSWDLAQGSIDNGLGTAILMEVARLLGQYCPHNYYSLELVWFNGEELGLFGSKKYMERHASEDIAVMINMDMTGYPTGFNAMGFAEFIPLLTALVAELNGFNLQAGVANKPGTNSDHMPFLLAGIPVLSLQAKLDENMLDSYHSQRDSFDKVNKKYLSESAAVISILVHELANRPDFPFRKRNALEMIAFLKSFGLDEKLKKQKEWPFGNK